MMVERYFGLFPSIPIALVNTSRYREGYVGRSRHNI